MTFQGLSQIKDVRIDMVQSRINKVSLALDSLVKEYAALDGSRSRMKRTRVRTQTLISQFKEAATKASDDYGTEFLDGTSRYVRINSAEGGPKDDNLQGKTGSTVEGVVVLSGRFAGKRASKPH